jgi:AcrR family transcriptional regulator
VTVALAPKGLSPGRPRSQESEEAILDATSAILAEEGYRGLTTDKIAARAHASKSTIYRRWPTKEHLALAAFDRLPMLTASNTGNVQEDLLGVTLQFAGFLHSTPMGGVLPALIAERPHNAALAAALTPVIERRREPVKDILRRAIARGELPAEVDLDMAVDLIMGPLMLRMFFVPGDLGREALGKMLEAILAGLRAHM